MEAKKLNGKNVQQAIDARRGGEYLAAGLCNATVKCLTEIYEVAEVVPKGSKIKIGNLGAGIVPALCLIESTKFLAGSIGTIARPDLFGSFSLNGTTTILMPPSPNEPLKASGDIFILTVAGFDAGGKISIKLFYTQ